MTWWTPWWRPVTDLAAPVGSSRSSSQVSEAVVETELISSVDVSRERAMLSSAQ